ncbi:MAG: bifunctional 5,10-methylene-tetrahydrofolate dehydrogenase/5,10-methylene-tetrahydrofolate cyclohydrolase [Bacteroidia bacterium]|nr:bifunctional 5,10-methylene-tetrahydrofolate dehydrogenase/5,10-methylene-tetrahydrofolate cyclohydrolase [Bacteroidia bacterium]MCZ2247825.1 bifunctional 5,10-methylene-tetrahydrofolate dehydrogenase/5,10-methylene-tetrahydrofolate cyclohydrolase [Bacteroidia bacterium]
MKLIDGKKVSEEIYNDLKIKVEQLKQQGQKVPHLAAVLVGNNPASQTYVNAKVKTCHEVGYGSTLIKLDENITEEDLLKEIYDLNNNPEIDGFIVQLPLPKHINENKVIEAIRPSKDVDGFHPVNLGRMMLNQPAFIPATPMGIMKLLEAAKIETQGKHCVVIGRSHIVGSPMSILMAKNSYPGNCTVTLCHSKTKNIEEFTKQADIIILAIGKPYFLKKEMIKEGVVVIDVGINRVTSTTTKSGFKLAGDADFDDIVSKCSHITPVPGGVGPMTIASLMYNTLLASQKNIYK